MCSSLFVSLAGHTSLPADSSPGKFLSHPDPTFSFLRVENLPAKHSSGHLRGNPKKLCLSLSCAVQLRGCAMQQILQRYPSRLSECPLVFPEHYNLEVLMGVPLKRPPRSPPTLLFCYCGFPLLVLHPGLLLY